MAPNPRKRNAAEATVDSVSGAVQLLWDWLGKAEDEEDGDNESDGDAIDTEGEEA